MQNKRGLSGIVATVILIALVMAASILVWTVVNNLVRGKLEGAGSCIDIFDKVTLNPAYTCFESGQQDFIFSISRTDIDLDAIVVLISGGGTTKSFTLTNESLSITDLKPFSGSGNVKMPGKNEGLTYNYTGNAFSSVPDSIKIAPVIGKKQCSASDEITQIESCSIVLN